MVALWSTPGMTLTDAGRRFLERSGRFRENQALTLDEAAGSKRIERAIYSITKKRFRSLSELQLFIAVMVLLTRGGRSTIYGIGEDEPNAQNEIGRIYAQHRIGPYYADVFVDCDFLGIADPLRLVIECDGPWHENPAQFRLDRKRDRWMGAEGYRVLRFASSEIMARGIVSAIDCAEEVEETITAHVRLERRLLLRRADFITCRLAQAMTERGQQFHTQVSPEGG